ncbi:SRPBCC family protein [Oceanispirochaeta sp.]|jgi:hypothetical protein|uniref:SRPBCC family protein n=1 Tax=Oceanispirochaeta sp. TaxID=2035350 RepID=UPI00261B88A4|nr:SRPBCC family protein [Oceanispirochaeta sp.]MDA3958674.1 hypothetical protein [Oceanispirochaeta sp.]
MNIQSKTRINSSKEKVWKLITNIENSNNFIRGIEKVEILEQKENELIGLKWKETRTMFGQTATEIMWITDARENESYSTRAESHGECMVKVFILFMNHVSVKIPKTIYSFHQALFLKNSVQYLGKILCPLGFIFSP